MNKLAVIKEKTILVKRDGEKIVVDMPYDAVEKAILGGAEIIKIGKKHTIRTKGINERYAYNVTDELEAWIDETYPDIAVGLMEFVKERVKKKMRVNKEIVANRASEIYSKHS